MNNKPSTNYRIEPQEEHQALANLAYQVQEYHDQLREAQIAFLEQLPNHNQLQNQSYLNQNLQQAMGAIRQIIEIEKQMAEKLAGANSDPEGCSQANFNAALLETLKNFPFYKSDKVPLIVNDFPHLRANLQKKISQQPPKPQQKVTNIRKGILEAIRQTIDFTEINQSMGVHDGSVNAPVLPEGGKYEVTFEVLSMQVIINERFLLVLSIFIGWIVFNSTLGSPTLPNAIILIMLSLLVLIITEISVDSVQMIPTSFIKKIETLVNLVEKLDPTDPTHQIKINIINKLAHAILKSEPTIELLGQQHKVDQIFTTITQDRLQTLPQFPKPNYNLPSAAVSPHHPAKFGDQSARPAQQAPSLKTISIVSPNGPIIPPSSQTTPAQEDELLQQDQDYLETLEAQSKANQLK